MKSKINAEVGKIIQFGAYEQDNNLSNGKEKIDWRILAVENGKVFLISEKILNSKPYNEVDTDVTWETCTLRKWLNNDFFNTAFSESEKSRIITSTVVTKYGTNGGNDTSDKLFLLSYDEVCNPAYVFSSDGEAFDTAREAQGTDFSKSNGLYVETGSSYSGNSNWWLRTPGFDSNYACYVNIYGGVYGSYYDIVFNTSIGIRPALWINL